MNDVYTAIMKAADQIEARPDTFNFREDAIPDGEVEGCGCALGWIGYFLRAGLSDFARVPLLMGISPSNYYAVHKFFQRMGRISEPDSNVPWEKMSGWRFCAAECARCLRIYAERYHSIPASVRSVFEEPCEEAETSQDSL
jgi:hypothetical protein